MMISIRRKMININRSSFFGISSMRTMNRSIMTNNNQSNNLNDLKFKNLDDMEGSSVSEDEINHFDKLGSTWWNELGPFKVLHQMNPIRIQFLRERILWDVSPTIQENPNLNESTIDSIRFLKGKKVLDVGCGGGIFSEVLARLGGEVIGLDASKDSLRAAIDHSIIDPDLFGESSKFKLKYQHSSIESLIKDNQDLYESFDLICAMEVLEHVQSPSNFIKSLADLTKPGGHIILSTISRTPLSKLLTITLAESNLPLIGIVPPGTHTYSKYINPQELSQIFRDQLGWAQNFERFELEIRGSTYDPILGKWSLLPRDFPGAGWCNYFLGVKKPLK